MYPSPDARELSILLRISRELDVVGDITATVEGPSELLAWANTVVEPTIAAWRAADSGHCYVQVTASSNRAPVRGQITAVLHCDRHPEFWRELVGPDLQPGGQRLLSLEDLSAAWTAMPIAPPT